MAEHNTLDREHLPKYHGNDHKHGGGDEIASATPAPNAIPKADAGGKLDAWITPSGSVDVAAAIHASTEKTTPVDADEVGLTDSAGSYVLKRLTWGNIKATLKTYFDALYSAIGHWHQVPGSYSLAIGPDALGVQDGGSQNIAIGAWNLMSLTEGWFNIAIGGSGIMSMLTTGESNIAIGTDALFHVATANGNVAVGLGAAKRANLSNNVAVGNMALFGGSAAEARGENVAIGYKAGALIAGGTAKTTGSNDVFIGADSRGLDNTSVGNEVVIGSGAVGHGANTVTIGNDDIINTYLKGTVHGKFAPRTVEKASSGTLAAADMQNSRVTNYGQTAELTITLNACAANLSFIYQTETTGAGAVHLKAGPTDKFYFDDGGGTVVALDDGDKISFATPAIGDTLEINAIRTGASSWDWLAVCIRGTAADGGA